MDDLLEVYLERFRSDKAQGIDAVIQMNISGENGGDYILTIRGGKFSHAPGKVEDADITVSSSFDDWMKINRGEANAMAMMMKGKVKIRGSVPLAMKFQSIFF